ncbi:MAG: sulfatase [Candidatus Eisenbacteria bacterium]|nr:sulfatase [Candidatus Eisenbacteria bacterium]
MSWKLRFPVFLLSAALSLSGCGKTADRPMNILIILVDTLRADHVGSYGYARSTTPHLDRLSEESSVFDHAYSHSPWTMPSVASLLTSLTPRDHGITDWQQPLDERFLTLAEWLSTKGYSTAAFVSHIIFRRKFHFDQGFRHYDQSVLRIGQSESISTSKEVTDLAVRWLREREDAPFFLWVHYFDPHSVYLSHEGFAFGDHPIDRYDSEIAFTDNQIGRLLDAVREEGILDDTIILFVADHGEEFLDHGGLEHSRTLFEELIRVPLMIRVPGVSPDRIREIVGMQDLAPTLLDLAGIEIPAEFRGESIPLVDGRFQPGEDRTIFAETLRFADKRGIRTGRWKLIEDRENGAVSLYDLEMDPGESRDAAADNPDVFRKMKGVLDGYYEVPRASIGEVELSEELKNDLKSLGYLR